MKTQKKQPAADSYFIAPMPGNHKYLKPKKQVKLRHIHLLINNHKNLPLSVYREELLMQRDYIID